MSKSTQDGDRSGLRDAQPKLVDPIAMARRDLKKNLPRRFYQNASTRAEGSGFAVLLDGKPILTPAKVLLQVPTATLADALALEWRDQTDIIEPDSMPLTRLANSAIDGVGRQIRATIAEVARFAETDLVCYRAGDPAALAAVQSAAWDPILAFAREKLQARFICAEGVMYVAQPPGALASVRREVEAIGNAFGGVFRLAALSVMTSLSGSVLLALAITRDAISLEAAWAAAHVDEDFATRLWGGDQEALRRREDRWRDMNAAALMDRCLRA